METVFQCQVRKDRGPFEVGSEGQGLTNQKDDASRRIQGEHNKRGEKVERMQWEWRGEERI